MNKKRETPSGLFMMEMIMVVFFFILCASTCILVFVKANQMSQNARDTNQGVLMAESAAEVWKAEGEKGLIERLGASKTEEGCYDLYWNRGFEPAKEGEEPAYHGRILLSSEAGMGRASISIETAQGDALFDLDVKKYREEAGL